MLSDGSMKSTKMTCLDWLSPCCGTEASPRTLCTTFVSFAGATGTFRLSGTLKGYLSTCVANCARDRNRLRTSQNVAVDAAEAMDSDSVGPLESVVGREESGRLEDLLAQLPYEQREVVVLHLHHEMRFRQVAETLGVSINTVQSRYRYGLDKLRSLLNSVVTK